MSSSASRPTERTGALMTFAALLQTSDAVSARVKRVLSRHRLTMSQLRVLLTLLERGPLCQRDIGRLLAMSNGNVTTVVDNLEKRDLVRRERTAEDRRFIRAALTESGRRIVRRVWPHHEAAVERLFSALSLREQATLVNLCQKLEAQNTRHD